MLSSATILCMTASVALTGTSVELAQWKPAAERHCHSTTPNVAQDDPARGTFSHQNHPMPGSAQLSDLQLGDLQLVFYTDPAEFVPSELKPTERPPGSPKIDRAATPRREIEPINPLTNARDPNLGVKTGLRNSTVKPESITATADLSGSISDRDSSQPLQGIKWAPATKLREELKALEALAKQQLSSPFELMVSSPIAPSPAVEMVEWTESINRQLDDLESLSWIGAADGSEILARMKEQASVGSNRAERITSSSHRKAWLCVAYSVTRRADVWQAVWNACQPMASGSESQLPSNLANDQSIQSQITAIETELEETRDSAAWAKFLLLAELRAFDAELEASANPNERKNTERKILAQRFLTRLENSQFNAAQARYLRRPTIENLRRSMRVWAAQPVDYELLLNQIEMQELNAIDQVSQQLADSLQNLRYSGKPADEELAKKLDLHYRNANIRIAIHSNFINRVLPNHEPMTVPLRTRAMGATIRGESKIKSSLTVSLSPSESNWNLMLHSNGDVTTLSTGHQSVVEIHTTGEAKFQSGTPLTVDQNGVNFKRTDVDVSGRIRLRKIESELDEYPVLGSFVRSVAQRRYAVMAPEANRISNRTVRQQIRSEIDGTLTQQTQLANQKIGDLVIEPLTAMNLAPQVTQMRTTEDSLLGRFRVAGEWQMAAFTPRPRAAEDSVINFQIHQSAINNTLEKLLPSGETMPIDQVLRNINASFGKENWERPQDLPEGVEVRFATSRPVSMEIEDNLVMLTLRIIQVKRGRAVDLRNVIIKAAYRPEVDGLHAYLVREGHLSITGPNMSMRKRLPARTIFNKVLSTNHSLPITPKGLDERDAFRGLAITQLDLERGWIGLAIGDSDAGKLALRQ